MKKTLTSILTVTIAAASLPVTALAADHSDPVTKNGERLKYNTSYYLKDKNLPDKGGVTFEHWGLDDFVLFANTVTDNGTPIIFENKDGADGFIESTDEIRIKSTQSSKSGLHYWARDTLLDSIYLSYDNTTDHIIYGSSEDNSIGIGSIQKEINESSIGLELFDFNEYHGDNVEKAWMGSINYPYSYDSNENRFILSLNNLQTPFEVIEVSE
ncbi:hypothetical protein [Bacillus sp. SRB3LM]|uniref:hypothetical protein n=1 Tax=Bacillus sp. SRB3LM TaxID=2608689 RepID=UPI0018C431F8|nr:hypothetical protein [Bacillus sp. SRB3LM]